jgi:hypothetical protein
VRSNRYVDFEVVFLFQLVDFLLFFLVFIVHDKSIVLGIPAFSQTVKQTRNNPIPQPEKK